MPTQVATQAFTFSELSPAARDRARYNWRNDLDHGDWWQPVYDDFAEVCKILGIRLATRTVRLYGGGTRAEPQIHFQLENGVTLSADYSYAPHCRKRIREYAPYDPPLHAIADKLFLAQRKNFYQLVANLSDGRHHSTRIEVWRNDNNPPAGDTESQVESALRDLIGWLWSRLQAEWDWINSDEQIEEGIEANDPLFSECGDLL